MRGMNNPSPTGHLGPDSADRPPDETVRLNHPRDLLTEVPFLLGFEPDPGLNTSPQPPRTR